MKTFFGFLLPQHINTKSVYTQFSHEYKFTQNDVYLPTRTHALQRFLELPPQIQHTYSLPSPFPFLPISRFACSLTIFFGRSVFCFCSSLLVLVLMTGITPLLLLLLLLLRPHPRRRQ